MILLKKNYQQLIEFSQTTGQVLQVIQVGDSLTGTPGKILVLGLIQTKFFEDSNVDFSRPMSF